VSDRTICKECRSSCSQRSQEFTAVNRELVRASSRASSNLFRMRQWSGARVMRQVSARLPLSAVSEAPTSEDLPFRCAVYGRCRYSELKAAAPGDYGICIRMSRSWSFAGLRLRSEHLGFSSGSQREWSRGGASESLERTAIPHSEECETQNQCACRSTSAIRGWRCGFMLPPAGMRRRPEEELRGGEALDNRHSSAAERTVPW
jgi:hypothetical protein